MYLFNFVMDDTQILISIDDERAKSISEVISNKTCKQILNYLSENEGTVSDVSNALKIPINTVDYNIKKLVKAELIEKKSFFWSVKGKKMPVYSVSNKRIIISPKSKSFAGCLKYLIAFLVTGFFAFVLKFFDFGKEKVGMVNDDGFGVMSIETFEKSTDVATKTGEVVFSGYLGMEVWLWFLFGAWFTILLFFIISLFSERREN